MNINIDLTAPESIDKLDDLKNYFDSGAHMMCDLVGRDVFHEAFSDAPDEVKAGIYQTGIDDGGGFSHCEVRSDDPQSFYYEYGAGFPGRDFPHPQADMGQYAKHSYNYVPNPALNPNNPESWDEENLGWYHDGKWYHGWPAFAFMWTAYDSMTPERVKEIAKEVFT